MTRLCALSLALVTLAGCTDEPSPVAPAEADVPTLAAEKDVHSAVSASTSVVSAEGFLDITIPSSCVGELVHLYGPTDIRIHTTVDGGGRPHQVAFYSWRDVTATGQDSGDTWHATAAVEQYTLFNYEPVEPHQPAPPRNRLGTPAVFHHSGAIRFVSDGDAPDLYVRHLVQAVVDADGNMRVDTDLLEVLACR